MEQVTQRMNSQSKYNYNVTVSCCTSITSSLLQVSTPILQEASVTIHDDNDDEIVSSDNQNKVEKDLRPNKDIVQPNRCSTSKPQLF